MQEESPAVPIIPTPKGPRHYSNSRMSTWRRCRRQYLYNYVERIEVPKSLGLRRGSAGHAALSTYYSGGTPQSAIGAAYDEFAPKTGTADKDWRLLEKILERYFEWAGENDQWTVLEVEKEVAVRMADRNFMGIIDLIVEREGKRYIVDHKFNKSPSVKHLELDSQVSTYAMIMAAKQTPIEGVIYNIVRVRDGGVAETEPVLRETILRTDPSLKVVAQESIRQAKEIDLYHQGKLPTYRSPTSQCHWDCSFYDLCIYDFERGD